MTPILLATDGSPSAEAATAEAIGLARSLGVPLVVASVAHETTPMYGGYYGSPEIAAELRRSAIDHAANVLARIQERTSEAGVPCTTLALEGPRGQTLCSAAAECEARLIVIGAHGWDRVERLIHGSVSTYVLQHAPCPVLVVHGNDVAADAEPARAAAVELTG
jgi:nucleotide-binding universal stress UspA family protein